MTPHAFIAKWRDATLKERSAAQEHFLDLCRLLDEPTPAEADPTGATYCFERGAVRTDTGGDGWADVWKRHCFAWEYKGQRANLDAAFMQLQQYALKRFSDSPCTAWARRGTSACTNAGGPMQAYSMDLRERALLDSDAGMKAADVAVKYRVSGSWVRLLKQRRRETGEVAPRVQRHGRRRMLEPHLHTLAALIAEQPDRTLAELKDALGTPASLATIWRAVAALDVTVKKNGPALRTRST